MDNENRLQYLQAMNITVWELKSPALPLYSVTEMSVTPQETKALLTESTPDVKEEPLSAQLQISSPVASVDNWVQLEQEVTNCQACGLCQTRTYTVFGSGNKQADWLLIGEAPGEQEDLQGKPFVGTAGSLLTEMIRAIGLSREQVFIANILKCRPPNNRDPHVDEIASCQKFLQRQIDLIQPKIIIAVGRIAGQSLLSTSAPLAKLRGIVHQYHNIPLIVIYHPAYLLRTLTQKKVAWQDLQFALKTYNQIKGQI